MPIIHADGKEVYVDFVEYERSGETFADIEYQKWLGEREVEIHERTRQQAHAQSHIKEEAK